MSKKSGNHESTESRAFKLTELTKYLVKMYKLPTEDKASLDECNGDGLRGYRKQIERILKNTKVNGRSLYDICTPVDGGPRKISISDFNKHCFLQWSDYLKNGKNENNKEVLEREKKIYERAKIIQENAEYDDVYDNEPEDIFIYSEEELEKHAMKLMIEGIFEAVCGEFDWRKLKYDLENKEYYLHPWNVEKIYPEEYFDGSELWNEEDGKYYIIPYEKLREEGRKTREPLEKSMENLKSYKNYIKDKDNK